MNPHHTQGRSTLPLTASARDALALFKTLDANDDDPSAGSSQGSSSVRASGPSQLQISRQDSPYVKAIPLLAATRKSSISSTHVPVGRRPTFKPLLPGSRPQPSEISNATTPTTSPHVDKDVRDKRQAADVHSDSTSSRQVIFHGEVKNNMSRTAAGLEAGLQSIRAVPLKRAKTTLSHDETNQTSQPQPSSRGGEFAKEIRKFSHAAREEREDPKTIFDESVTTVPSSRTSSLNELKVGDVDVSNLYVTAGGRNDKVNCSAAPDSVSSRANDPVHRVPTSKRKKAVQQRKLPPSISQVPPNNGGSGFLSDSDEDWSPGKGKNKKKQKNSTPVLKATRSNPISKPTRIARGNKTRKSEPLHEVAEQNTSEASEGCDLKPSAFVLSLPKRKAARKAGGADSSMGDGDNNIDETSQYLRENWESSAGSSEEEGQDETDYDDEEGITGIKRPKRSSNDTKPPRSKSSKAPLSATCTISKAGSRTGGKLANPKSSPVKEEAADENQKKRRAYFEQVDDFEMEVENVL